MGPMAAANEREKKFEILISKFSGFVKSQVFKSNVQRFGIDPDDVVQEIQFKIWKLVEGEKPINNYASYIRKIIISSTIDHIRRLKKDEMIFQAERQKQISDLEMMYKPDSLRNGGAREIVGRAVEALMESRKNVVKLYLLNMNLEEISQFYGWSTHKTRNLLYRGLTDLKRILSKMDNSHGNE